MPTVINNLTDVALGVRGLGGMPNLHSFPQGNGFYIYLGVYLIGCHDVGTSVCMIKFEVLSDLNR